ncbi:MAG: glycosyltransferase family 1 protein [Tannerellaceae bacterium]|jgi:hypothetical protein|nr:glycosyltransferase family 1 protein [Tannerellaceae bacterium]
MDKYINIVALNVPYPANYGGIIDIYYKIKALHAAGVKIILHCFEYERPPARELDELCQAVYYYKRRTGWPANLSVLPYNVYSRKHAGLLKNLSANDYPVLFEGLHSCYYMNNKHLPGRLKVYRESNIEHDYYRMLAQSCTEVVKKAFFLVEAWRFRRYQQIIGQADLTLAVSMADTDYLRKAFPGKRIEFMPSFHPGYEVTAAPGQSDFILYHGKLSVVENEQAALYLVRHVFSKLSCTCVIAGMAPSARLKSAIATYPHIRLEANPAEERMAALVKEAQVHLLVTFQETGLKLKLLNSLFAGRHIVVNKAMLTGSGLSPLCHIADTPGEMIAACARLLAEPFTPEETARRTQFLIPAYSNKHQAGRLIQMIYGEK